MQIANLKRGDKFTLILDNYTNSGRPALYRLLAPAKRRKGRALAFDMVKGISVLIDPRKTCYPVPETVKTVPS